MKKLLSIAFVITAFAAQPSFAGDKPSKEERKALAKECRVEAKAENIDMKDKEAMKKYMGKCIRTKFKAKSAE